MIVILTAGTMLIFSVSFQFFRMLPEGAIVQHNFWVLKSIYFLLMKSLCIWPFKYN